MSVKFMTTEQLHNDIASVHNMWAGGIPPEQNDRVNALKAELKRRGVTAQEIRPEMPAPRSLIDMNDEQLAKELQSLTDRLSKNPGDEESQTRFADLRFELRNRTKKNGNGNGKVMQLEEVQRMPGTNGNSFEPGAVTRHTAEMPRRNPEAEEAMKQEFLAAQARGVASMEAAMRKMNLAKVAADVAAQTLAKHSDPNGDDIENACTIGLAVAQNIFAKVGL